MFEILISGFKVSFIVGLIYGIGAIGLSLIYKYLKFPDLTMVISITIGSLAVIQFSNHVGIWAGLIGSALCGTVLGLVTGVQIAYFRIPAILAGIITSTAGWSAAFYLNRNEAQAAFRPELRDRLDWIVDNVFSYSSLVRISLLAIFIAFLVSRCFKLRWGLYVLAFLGSDNYLEFRHRQKRFVIISVVALGNTLIGFAGGLAAIQNNAASIPNHLDFLYIALGGYAIGNLAIQLLGKTEVRQYFEKDNKPLSSLWLKPIILFSGRLHRNDEDPSKIFYTLTSYVVAAAVINWVFKTVETQLRGDRQNLNFAAKAGIIFLIILISSLTEKMSKTTKLT
jgi:ABC-type uncharacterized transport system permease subunit